MRIKLNYASFTQQTCEQWAFLANEIIGEVKPTLSETLEAILEQNGATIDKRERLIPQSVLYAELELGKVEALNVRFSPYCLKIESQTAYASKEKD